MATKIAPKLEGETNEQYNQRLGLGSSDVGYRRTAPTAPTTPAEKMAKDKERLALKHELMGVVPGEEVRKTTGVNQPNLQGIAEGVYVDKNTGATYDTRGVEATTDIYKDPLQKQKDKLEEESDKFYKLQVDLKMMSQQFTEQLDKASDAFQTSFKQLSQALGDQASLFASTLQGVQDKSGKVVDITAPGFQEAMMSAQENGQSFEDAMKPFLVEPQVKEGEVLKLSQEALKSGLSQENVDSAMQSFQAGILSPQEARDYFTKHINKQEEVATAETGQPVQEKVVPQSTKQNEEIPEITEQPLSDSLVNAFDKAVKSDSASMYSMIEGLNLDMSQATTGEIMQLWLLQQNLAYTQDQTINDYLNKLAVNARKGYEEAMDLYGAGGTAVKEIDKAISGKDFTPTTYEGLTAKIYQQGKDLQTESIQIEKDYLDQQYNAWKSQEQDKRGRLEGYLKAKLYATGAQDSTAGLSVMALQVNAADMRMQLKEGEYQYSMSKLNLESRRVMTDYTNNVVKLVMDTEAKKGAAVSAYDDKLLEIEKLFIEDDREKNKLRLDAMSNFTDKMYELDKDQKAQEWKEYQQSYNEMQDAINNAFKLNGETGTIHYLDENGAIVDSGVPTLDAKKWQDSNMLDVLKYERNVNNDAWDKAKDLLDAGLDSEAELLLGLTPGTLSEYETLEQKNARIREERYNQEVISSIWDTLVSQNGAIASAYKEGTYMTGAYGDLQCGEFMHKFVTNYPYGLHTLEQKISSINSNVPEVGSIVITDESTTSGHLALINSINEDGTMTLTEANYAAGGVITNTRKIKPDDPRIKGYFKGTLAPEFEKYIDKGEQEYITLTPSMLANTPLPPSITKFLTGFNVKNPNYNGGTSGAGSTPAKEEEFHPAF